MNLYAMKNEAQEFLHWGVIEDCDAFIQQCHEQNLTVSRLHDRLDEFKHFLEQRLRAPDETLG